MSETRGQTRGQTKGQTEGQTPGSDPGSDRFPVAQEPAALAEAPGTLTVFSRVPMDLYISGKRVGSTESGPIILPPGVHRVELVSERLNYRGTATLNIRPAAVTSHTVTLPNGRLQVNTEPGAQVSIEGQADRRRAAGTAARPDRDSRGGRHASQPGHAARVRRSPPRRRHRGQHRAPRSDRPVEGLPAAEPQSAQRADSVTGGLTRPPATSYCPGGV